MRRWVGAVKWVWLVVVSTVLVGTGGYGVAGVVDPPSQGVAGTAVVTHCTDQGTGRCYGDFSSDDGRARLVSARIWGEDNARPGTRLRAYDDTAHHEVDVPGSSDNVTFSVIALVVGLGAWALLAYAGVRMWRRRRPAVG
jgi:hypothetical protein